MLLKILAVVFLSGIAVLGRPLIGDAVIPFYKDYILLTKLKRMEQMIVNIYYLIVGMLSILFSFTHAINGHQTILKLIDSSNMDITSKLTIFYVWHIITIENFIFGIAFIAMAFYKNKLKIKFIAWLIAVIIIARWGVVFVSTLLNNSTDIIGTLIDSIAIIIFVTLIILGTIKKDKAQL